jgi:branched-chain amino acid transport system substrate-binding protein
MAPRATVSGWTRFKAAEEWLDRNMPLPPGAAMSSASSVAPSAPAAAPAAAPQDPLYREFLEWRASRAKANSSR